MGGKSRKGSKGGRGEGETERGRRKKREGEKEEKMKSQPLHRVYHLVLTVQHLLLNQLVLYCRAKRAAQRHDLFSDFF